MEAGGLPTYTPPLLTTEWEDTTPAENDMSWPSSAIANYYKAVTHCHGIGGDVLPGALSGP